MNQTIQQRVVEINGKYYDFAPENKSFLQTAYELKTLGIKNYYFMLRLDNPMLAGVDPFTTKHPQQIKMIMQEVKNNIWYYIRTCVRVRTDAGIIPYELHRGLAAFIWSFENRYDFCVCQPRQTYKTYGIIAGPISWAFQLSQNLNVHFFGNHSDITKRNLGRLKDTIEILPPWLQFKQYKDASGSIKKTRQSAEVLENKLLHNKLEIHPTPVTAEKAKDMARGASAAMLYFDEIEHTPFFPVLLANSAPAYKTASENARLSGLPYGRFMSTTPGDLDSKTGREAKKVIDSMIPWSETLYDKTRTEIEEYMDVYREQYHSDENKSNDREVIEVFYMEYHYYQVRKTYDWVLEQFSLSGDKMAIRREILLERLRGSSNSPISQEDLELLISNMQKANKDILIHNKWRFLLYPHGQARSYHGELKDLDDRIPYLVGVDPAGGGGGDYSAITIINPYNLQIAAEFRNPYISGTDLCRLLVTLIEDYIPKGVIIPERNSMGIFLIHMMCEETTIRENIYWSDSIKQLDEMTEDSEDDHQLKAASDQYKKYGTYTSTKVRHAMIELLFKHVNECRQLLNTEYLVDDICKLVRSSTGKVQAGPGEHDDSLMSYLHAIYVYYTGDNLDAFGIHKEFHPIIGPVQEDLEERLMGRDPLTQFFSTEEVTFETLVVEDKIRMEDEIKFLVSQNLTGLEFRDEIHTKRKEQKDPYDSTVSLNPMFFDMMNGTINNINGGDDWW